MPLSLDLAAGPEIPCCYGRIMVAIIEAQQKVLPLVSNVPVAFNEFTTKFILTSI
jgi:hypothetical protein